MAVYAATTTLDIPHAERMSENLGVTIGKCDITNYNQIGVENTVLTGQFQSIQRVITDGLSDNGYPVRWNTNDKCFHAYNSTTAAEVANDVDVGEVNFMAIGLI